MMLVKVCPHLFPKQETLYPETGDFGAVFGNKVACFRIQSLCLGNKCGHALMMTSFTLQGAPGIVGPKGDKGDAGRRGDEGPMVSCQVFFRLTV